MVFYTLCTNRYVTEMRYPSLVLYITHSSSISNHTLFEGELTVLASPPHT